MAIVEFAARARDDLREISAYLKREGSPRVAQATLTRIRDRVRQLARNPRLGPQREVFGGRYTLVCGAYLVIYIIDAAADGARVVVLRIVHSARDVPKLLEGK